MKCLRCQTRNRESRRLCYKCGALLALACPSCGFSNGTDENFCGGCGQELKVSTAPAPASAPKLGFPKSYTSNHLAEEIPTSESENQAKTPQELRSARHKLGLTQAQLGNKLGLSIRTMIAYEMGERDKPKTVELAIRALKKEGN